MKPVQRASPATDNVLTKRATIRIEANRIFITFPPDITTVSCTERPSKEPVATASFKPTHGTAFRQRQMSTKNKGRMFWYPPLNSPTHGACRLLLARGRSACSRRASASRLWHAQIAGSARLRFFVDYQLNSRLAPAAVEENRLDEA